MKNISGFLMALAVSFSLSACGGSAGLMKQSTSQVVSAAAEGSVKIVFMRTSFVAGAITAEIFEVENGKLKLVGALPTGNKIVYETTPGEKVFMAYGNAADFMKANVVAGKTYYSIVRPNWGTGGFAPTPIRTNGTSDYNTDTEDFEKWLSSTVLIEKKSDDEADVWMKKNEERMSKVYEKYWARWERKSVSEKEQRTLNPGDGLPE